LIIAPGAVAALLGGLEQDRDATLQRSLLGGEQLRHHERDRGVAVVAAGVHQPLVCDA
jgi:hypothetical protein